MLVEVLVSFGFRRFFGVGFGWFCFGRSCGAGVGLVCFLVWFWVEC